MAFVSTFSFTLQILAAFVIFLFGYVAILISIICCFAILKVLYEGTKWALANVESSAEIQIDSEETSR